MTKTLDFLLLSIITLCIIGCSGKETATEDKLILKIDFDNIEDISNISEITDTIELKGTSDDLPGIILRSRIYCDNMYLLDPLKAPGLYVFDLRGNYIRKIGNIGQGPGELFDYTDFDVTPDRILILDNISQKINIYSHEGVFIESQKVEPMTMNIATDKDSNVLWLDRGNVTSFKSDPLVWKLCRHTAESDSTFLSVPEALDGITISPRNNFCKSEDGTIYYMPSLEPFIYTLEKGKLVSKLHLDLGSKWPDQSFFERHRNDETFTTVKDLKDGGYVVNLSFLENQKWIVTDFKIKDDYFISVYNKTNSNSRLFKSSTGYDWGHPISLDENRLLVASAIDGVIISYLLNDVK